MPVFSIVVPYFRSRSTVAYALESAQRASQGLDVEILLVDDGSTPPAEQDLKGLRHAPHRIIRQENRGLLFARLRGLQEAKGDFILFLDADDLIGSQKLRGALDAFADPEVVTVYTDTAKVRLDGEYGDLMIKLDPATPKTEDMAEFFITIQPAPHSPVFRATFLRELVATPLFPPLPAYNPVAEIWFYFNAAVRPGKVRHVPGPETICGVHGGERITNCWEKMAVASLLAEEAFVRACPRTPETVELRRRMGEKVFRSWRALPFDFLPEYQKRKIRMWKSLPKSRLQELGHGKFQILAKAIGAYPAGWFMRRIQNRKYERIRTLPTGKEIENF